MSLFIIFQTNQNASIMMIQDIQFVRMVHQVMEWNGCFSRKRRGNLGQKKTDANKQGFRPPLTKENIVYLACRLLVPKVGSCGCLSTDPMHVRQFSAPGNNLTIRSSPVLYK
jgi:hypothetical protein